MPDQSLSRTKSPVIQRWAAGRTPLRWGAGAAVARRTFEDDLALFERQVEEESRRRNGRS